MKLTSLVMMLLIAFSAAAQEEFFDDVYFSSKNKKKKEQVEEKKVVQPKQESRTLVATAKSPGLPCPEDGAAQLCRRDAECQCLGRECLFLLHSGPPPLPDGEWAAGQRPIVAADDAVTRKDCARKIGHPHRGDGRQCGQHAQSRTHQTYRTGQTGGQRNAQSQQCGRFVQRWRHKN